MPRLLAPAVLLLCAAAPALADPTPTGPVRAQSGKVCMDTLGGRHAPTCHSITASRIETDPDICVCGGGFIEAAAPYCGPNEAPAPDSRDADRARLAAFKANGTLVGASYQGHSFCVTRGRSGESR